MPSKKPPAKPRPSKAAAKAPAAKPRRTVSKPTAKPAKPPIPKRATQTPAKAKAAAKANAPPTRKAPVKQPGPKRAARAKAKADAKPPAKPRAARKRRAAVKRPPVDLHALGAHVVSVFGPFNSRVLIEMRAETALALFPNGGLVAAARTKVIEAVERDLEDLRESSAGLADSGLAATAVSLAYEIEHPYNSATSKAACAKALMEAMATLRTLAPPAETKDDLDSIAARRTLRLAGGTAT